MSSPTTDGELLDRWAQGSSDAANELIERHFSSLYRFFRGKVGAEGQDLVQQTFLACLEARTQYRGDASFRTFLLAIARHQLYAHYRKRGRSPTNLSLSSVRDQGSSPSGIASRHERAELLAHALRSLPLDAQVLLELAYYEDMSGPDIARVLEVPLNTAYSRLHRARCQLREHLHRLAPDAPVPLPGARVDKEV